MTAGSGDLKEPDSFLSHRAAKVTATAVHRILQDVLSDSKWTNCGPCARIRTCSLVSICSCRLRWCWHEGCVKVGLLPTWFMGQVALPYIKRVTGVKGVVDRVQVKTDRQHNPEPNFSAPVFLPAMEDERLEAKQFRCLVILRFQGRYTDAEANPRGTWGR